MAATANGVRSSPVVELKEIVKTSGAVSSSSLADDTASSMGSSPPSSYDNSPTSRSNRQQKKKPEEKCDGGGVETVCLLEKQQSESIVKVAESSQIQVNNSVPNNFSSFGRNARFNNYGQVKMGQTVKATSKVNMETGNAIQDDSINAEACSLGNFNAICCFF